MKYKFAHFADVHWRGLTRHKEYQRAFEDAFATLRSENVDAIFIAGDIVHSKTQGISPELIDNLCWWFREMSEIAPVYVTLGNHDGLIMNKDREDAISPIIRALDIPSIILSKYTETININDEICMTNFSCFDEEAWPEAKPKRGKINIGLFHGAVTGSKTDINWELDGEVDEVFFKGFDFVFLGDIHKHQYLDAEERIAYCGSTIQQNFGETPNKGFMIWEIDSKDVYQSRHIEVLHDMPYVTVDWMGNVADTLDEAEKYPDKSRFRIKTNVAISQGEIKQIYSALKEFKNATEIVMKHDVPKPDLLLENPEQSGRLNLRNPSVVSDMIKSYYKRADLSETMNSSLEDMVHRFWRSVSKVDATNTGCWSIKSLEFDNVFGYGKGNKINFDDLNGITGIFGKNRIGKSSICGTLMYALFNTTDRGTMSNLHVINSRKGHCKATAVISKRGKNYRIERQSVKKETKAGKLSVSTHLNLLEIDSEGNVLRDLCGEQRRETEKTLREIVGNPEDFLLTSFASQGEMNAFLSQKASSRKSVLSKFLDLDVFDQLSDAAKQEAAGVKHQLRSVPDRDFDVSIIESKNKLNTKLTERDLVNESLDILRERSRSLDLTLETRDDKNLVTTQDLKTQELRVENLHSRKDILKEKVGNLESRQDELSKRTQKLQNLKDAFPLSELKLTLETQKELDNTTTKIKHQLDKEKQKLKLFIKEAEKLEDDPCSEECPINKYLEGAQKAKKSIKGKEKVVDSLGEDLRVTRKELKKLQDRELEKKLEKYNELMRDFGEVSLKKNKVDLDFVETANKLDKIVSNIEDEVRSLDEMKVNVATDDIAEKVSSMRLKLKTLRDEESNLKRRHLKLSEEIGQLHARIQKLKEEKAEYENLIEQWRVFELFMQATSKNGVPLEIIRSRLPELNLEIASILQGVTGFTVDLESNEGSNDMDIYINYGDSRRIIECASGMEKMMSAMAIRVALTNVSELSKSNIFVIDEGFGALDAGNIEASSRFLESLKKWFQSILIISHVDAVKDTVDNVLEIDKDGKDAFVK
jgi:DNA repair exonuclease SbcCD ATPase subunit/DNA repair exonuclease SbcCD nuclease subunit